MRQYNKILYISALSLLLIIQPNLCLRGQTKRLIAIDPLVSNEIKRSISSEPGQKVIVLPDHGNPIMFITNELKGSSFDEIHLFLLTKPGSIIFDEINIIPENIQDYSGHFGEWKSIIKPGTEIIIHSENLISEPEGLFLIKRIMEYTGSVVIVKK